jgi:hypothetical protein
VPTISLRKLTRAPAAVSGQVCTASASASMLTAFRPSSGLDECADTPLADDGQLIALAFEGVTHAGLLAGALLQLGFERRAGVGDGGLGIFGDLAAEEAAAELRDEGRVTRRGRGQPSGR